MDAHDKKRLLLLLLSLSPFTVFLRVFQKRKMAVKRNKTKSIYIQPVAPTARVTTRSCTMLFKITPHTHTRVHDEPLAGPQFSVLKAIKACVYAASYPVRSTPRFTAVSTVAYSSFCFHQPTVDQPQHIFFFCTRGSLTRMVKNWDCVHLRPGRGALAG